MLSTTVGQLAAPTVITSNDTRAWTCNGFTIRIEKKKQHSDTERVRMPQLQGQLLQRLTETPRKKKKPQVHQ